MHSFPPFTVTVDPHSRTVTLSGEVDLAAAPALAELTAGSTEIRSVDLSSATFLDTTVLTFLVGLDHRQKEHGDRLSVMGAPPIVRKMFAITGLLNLLATPRG